MLTPGILVATVRRTGIAIITNQRSGSLANAVLACIPASTDATVVASVVIVAEHAVSTGQIAVLIRTVGVIIAVFLGPILALTILTYIV